MRIITILCTLSVVTVALVIIGLFTLKPELLVLAGVSFLIMFVWLMYSMRADAKP